MHALRTALQAVLVVGSCAVGVVALQGGAFTAAPAVARDTHTLSGQGVRVTASQAGGPTPTPRPTPTAVPSQQPDVNGDGVTSSVDGLCILRLLGAFAATASCPAGLYFPDINFDGATTAIDALCVLRWLGDFTGNGNCPLSQSGVLTLSMEITANREPGLAGSFTLTPLGGNQLRVEVIVTGFPPNDQSRPAHIHGATGARCDTGAAVTYGLPNLIVDGTGRGTSTTTITLTAAVPIRAGNAYLNVHNPALGGAGVICGDIPLTYASG